MTRTIFLALMLFTVFCTASAQSLAPINGIRENPSGEYAFVHAILTTSPGREIADGVLLVREGRVVASGPFGTVIIPPGATQVDLKGYRMYPAFIDPWSAFGVPPAPKSEQGPHPPQYDLKEPGISGWNAALKPGFSVKDVFQFDAKTAEALRANGFACVNAVPNDGIMRGNSALVSLDAEAKDDRFIQREAAQCLSFEKGSSPQPYPSSQMGAIALLRQAFYDAEWFAASNGLREIRDYEGEGGTRFEPEQQRWLTEFLGLLNASSPRFFEVEDTQELFRAEKISKEFALPFVYKTDGQEYEWPAQVAALRPRLIIPLNFPKAMDISSPADAREVSLGRLRRWMQAPANPSVLEHQSVFFAFTLAGLEKPADLFPAIRKAIAYGLSDTAALAALTTRPASLLNVEGGKGGRLDAGNAASFIICSDSLFSQHNVIYENWIEGKRHIIQARPLADLRGMWELEFEGSKHILRLRGKIHAPDAAVRMGKDTTWQKADFRLTNEGVGIFWKTEKGEWKGGWRFEGMLKENSFDGILETPAGKRVAVRGSRSSLKDDYKPDPGNEFQKPEWIPAVTSPNKAFGTNAIPPSETVLIRHATIWTNARQGRLEDSDILVRNGKIAAIGKGLSSPGGAREIDAKGMHVTPGIIDEHSHIAISKGVNEGSHSVTSEVRIGDVLDATDINIYRQLSGGVTTSHLLHGSANSIGGQTALIKLRWGMPADSLKFTGADPFIKFALGENVKQSNWGDLNTVRYPQTRMGVEQIMEDAFNAALEYEKRCAADPKARKNLQLEALLEILRKKRFITCHSYVQSEITMLMRLAERLGFRVNTFTHVLEGYKIADKLKAHGAYASTFADWWAYKYEVIDAIPHNASLLTEKGVITCINSDDAEMGRRLNQEAAKAIKYGGMSEEEALKMVTLNPARALHIDKRVGSLQEGMDADIVLWSGNPLSIYSRAEKTWIEGRMFFDRESEQKAYQENQAEKNRLIQLMIASPEAGKVPPSPDKPKKEYHCETLESDYNE